MAKSAAYHTHDALKKYLDENATGEYEYILDSRGWVNILNISGSKLVRHTLYHVRDITYEQAEAVVQSINS